MSSGVKVCDSVVNCFTNMKVRKTCTKAEVLKRKKAIMMILNDTNEMIVLDETREILVGDVQQGVIKDPFQHFLNMFRKGQCCYAVYDASYETKESKKEELIFVYWAPDDATVAQKLIYASSKDGLKRKLQGMKHEWQVNSYDDLADLSTLARKLGSDVVSIENRQI
ncbi:cofilin-2-like [Rhinoraja longicauda]